ncbi:MAG: hypothetical protein KF729_35890 [Sandaracinaceae bacterium]|nr:hypothetical protein [Sandaracinaceae bacterium]
MHEHGLMTKLLRSAEREARERGAALRGVVVRLGAMASSDPDHFRAEFEHVTEELGLGPLTLEVHAAPDHPAGVELLSVVLGEPRG